MTHLPKAELVGVLAPYSINPRDIGGNIALVSSGWKDTGFVVATLGLEYFGNGIVISCENSDHIFRSTDYGNTWFDEGAVLSALSSALSITYIGNGIGITTNSNGHVNRTTDFGVTWTDLGAISGFNLFTSAYFGNGIVLIGANDGHVFRSTDFGLTYVDLGAISGGGGPNVRAMTYLDNGIAIFGNLGGQIFRSVDYGANWVTLGNITGSFNAGIAYLGNGIVILGTSIPPGHIWRSTDFGLTWVDEGGISAGGFTFSVTYLGNGIVIAGDGNGHIFKSINFGLTWADLGAISAFIIHRSIYLGNGIALFSDDNGHVWRNDIAYKLDEAQVLLERPVTIVNADITVGQSHDTIIVDSPGANRIITLQDAQLPGMTGHEFTIVNIAANCIVTIATVNNRTINGALNPTLDVQWQSMTVKSNGVNWNIT